MNVDEQRGSLRDDPEVSKLLGRRYPSFHKPLARVRSWNWMDTPDSLGRALAAGQALKERYPHVLKVRYELAFSLVKLQRPEEALREIEQTDREFTVLDEDAYALWGRIPKERGDLELSRECFSEAERAYRAALDKYQRGLKLSKNYFSAVNVAALKLVLASVMAKLPGGGDRNEIERLREASESDSQELLSSCRDWKEVHSDDRIWIRATEGEVCLLLEKWTESGKAYQAALRQPNAQPSHSKSMRSQVERILAAFERLGVPICDPFHDLDALFVIQRT